MSQPTFLTYNESQSKCDCCNELVFTYQIMDDNLCNITRYYGLQITSKEKEFMYEKQKVKADVKIYDNYAIGSFMSITFDDKLKEQCRNKVKEIYVGHITIPLTE